MDVHWAWLAGLLDGEGSFSLSRKKQGSRWIYGPVVRVDMCHEPTIRRVSELLTLYDVVHRYFYYQRKNKRHRAAHIVQVSQLHSIHTVCMRLLPYLVTKAEHARVLVRYTEVRLAANHRGLGGVYKTTYTGEEASIFAAMRVLNERGTGYSGE